MIAVLKYWRVGLIALAAISLLVIYFYIGNLRSDLDDARLEREQYKLMAEQNKAYISKYEAARKQNDILTRENQRLAESIQDDSPTCSVPNDLRALLQRL